MNSLKYLCILFAFISTCSATSCKKICILDNLACVTKGAFNVYKNVVKGVKGLLKPLDPLNLNNGGMNSSDFILTNITLAGLRNCTVTALKLNVTGNTFKQYLHCPTLKSHFYFNGNEDSDSPILRGSGSATITVYDYDILNYGRYSVFVNKDHRPHFFIISHKTNTQLKGKLKFEIPDDCVVDESRVNDTETYMNTNWKKTEQYVNTPIVKRAMGILINNIDIYLRSYTMGEVLPFRNRFH